MIAQKLWKAIRARRFFVCSTATITSEMPIESNPKTTVQKKNPDRAISRDRMVVADVRRGNLGFQSTPYYTVRVPSFESLSLLLASITSSFPGVQVEMAKRDIASSFWFPRLRNAL